MSKLTALTRWVGPELAACELTHFERAPIDPEAARAEHVAYLDALRDLCQNAVGPRRVDAAVGAHADDGARRLERGECAAQHELQELGLPAQRAGPDLGQQHAEASGGASAAAGGAHPRARRARAAPTSALRARRRSR